MAHRKAIELEDIAGYRVPSSLLYSPDGRYLAFEVKRADLEKNTYHTDIWLACGGCARQVTWSLDAGIVRWLDDRRLILRRKTDATQPGTTDLFLLDVCGGEAQPWLTLPFGLSKLEKVTETVFAVLGQIDEADPDAYLDPDEKRKEKAEKKKEESDYTVVDEVPYWFNGAGFTNGKRTALFLMTAEAKEPPADAKVTLKRITDADFSVGSICVDGERIFYTGNTVRRFPTLTDRVFVYDTAAKRKKTIWRKDDRSVSGLFMLGGDLHASVSDMKTYGVNQTPEICRIDEKGISCRFTPSVSLYSSVIGDTAEGGASYRAFPDEYLTLATIEAHNAVFAFTEKPGSDELECRTVWEQEGMLCTMDASRDKIAVVYQDWDHVAEVYEMNRDGSGFTRITALNDAMLDGRYIAYPNRLDYTSEGTPLRGWVLLPENFSMKKKYPAILDVHGGPRCAYGETFFHEMQLWAARGYVVFFTNIRGSDGRGDAFADIRDDYGGTDFRNLMDFTDAVLEAYPNIDRERVCETGGSYGGFMTNWIITHTDRFCAAASQRSISNWVSFSFISDIGTFFGPDQCGAPGLYGERNTEYLWDHSPLKYADKAVTPTLFIHSDEDYRCPLPEGMQMMQALADRNIPARMCIFHGENHELSRSGKPKHRIRRLEEITGWFDRYTAKK